MKPPDRGPAGRSRLDATSPNKSGHPPCAPSIRGRSRARCSRIRTSPRPGSTPRLTRPGSQTLSAASSKRISASPCSRRSSIPGSPVVSGISRTSTGTGSSASSSKTGAARLHSSKRRMSHPCYGDPAWTYSDVERAIQARLQRCDMLALHCIWHAAEIDAAERAVLAQLRAKYDGVRIPPPVTPLTTRPVALTRSGKGADAINQPSLF